MFFSGILCSHLSEKGSLIVPPPHLIKDNLMQQMAKTLFVHHTKGVLRSVPGELGIGGTPPQSLDCLACTLVRGASTAFRIKVRGSILKWISLLQNENQLQGPEAALLCTATLFRRSLTWIRELYQPSPSIVTPLGNGNKR